MSTAPETTVNEENRWRLSTPGSTDWDRSPRAGADNKYFIVSVDTHLSPPHTLFRDRIDPKYRDRLPRMEVRDGQKFIISEGQRPYKLMETLVEGEDLRRVKAGGAPEVEEEAIAQKRIADEALDGVDGEVIFPNGPALLMWSSNEPDFVMAQARIWNDWVMETCGRNLDKLNPVAALAPAGLEASIEEAKRVAKAGFRIVALPSKPIWGEHDISHLNYNMAHFDPLWEVLQDLDLAICFHVSTGKDPRAARGAGGAIINYVVHSMPPTMEPIVNLCSSGVFERFPRLRAGTIEANAGWIPWMLDSMDEAYKKHHFWVKPKLKQLPSDYFRSNCFASIAEDRSALMLAEAYGLVDNLMWANDYPHHEGSWPHSAEAIERTMGHLQEESRAKILGLNAARIFNFKVPANYL